MVELSLAVGFIGILSLTVTLIINDTVATYRRGLTLNNINTTGIDLVDDFRAGIQSAPSKDAKFDCEGLYPGSSGISARQKCENDDAKLLVVQQYEAPVYPRGEAEKDSTGQAQLPIYGAVCTGSYSYIWNSGYFFGENKDKKSIDPNTKPAYLTYDLTTYNPGVSAPTTVKKTIGFGNSDDDPQQFRLLKVKDERRAVCKSSLLEDEGNNVDHYAEYPGSSGFNLSDNEFNITGFYDGGIRDEDIEILLKDEVTNPLALYDFTMTPPASNVDNKAAFYSASFILGTLQGGLNVTATGNFCKTPTEYDNDFDYCAINKFNFAAQATGG